MKEDELEASEFGKGLVICLVKFAEHLARWPGQKELYGQMAEKSPELFNVSGAVEMFFNAASDHLYEMQVPTGWNSKWYIRGVGPFRYLSLAGWDDDALRAYRGLAASPGQN